MDARGLPARRAAGVARHFLPGSMLRKLAARASLFDFGAEFANLVVPGGGVVVKLVDRISKG